MKNIFKKNLWPNMLSSLFTKTALNSSSACPGALWQQPKMPKCILNRDLDDSNNQKD